MLYYTLYAKHFAHAPHFFYICPKNIKLMKNAFHFELCCSFTTEAWKVFRNKQYTSTVSRLQQWIYASQNILFHYPTLLSFSPIFDRRSSELHFGNRRKYDFWSDIVRFGLYLTFYRFFLISENYQKKSQLISWTLSIQNRTNVRCNWTKNNALAKKNEATFEMGLVKVQHEDWTRDLLITRQRF